MKVRYSKKFLKQLSKLPYGVKKKIELFVFDDLPSFDNLELSGKIEKMKGFPVIIKFVLVLIELDLKSEEIQ